jgi:hypothetical protein
MTRAEHEGEVPRSSGRSPATDYRWLASPIYQEFLTGERKLKCAPWGSITRNPYGWKGPCYLLTDGIFPTYDSCSKESSGRSTARATTPLRALRDPLGLRTVGGLRGGWLAQGERQEHGVDADGLTFACAMTVEERSRDELGGRRSSGSAPATGSRRPPGVRSGSPAHSRDLRSGRSSTRPGVVDERARSLGRAPLGCQPARPGTILGASRIVDDPAERRGCTRRRGAERSDMESGHLARSGRLAAVCGAISDTPDAASRRRRPGR